MRTRVNRFRLASSYGLVKVLFVRMLRPKDKVFSFFLRKESNDTKHN